MSSRINGSALMFTEEDIKTTTKLLPRLIRIIMYGLSITNEGYLERYHHSYREVYPDRTRKEFSQKAAADRKFMLDKNSLTFNMMDTIITAMGYDVDSVSVTLRDRLTGDTRTFSSDASLEELRHQIQSEKEVGISSII